MIILNCVKFVLQKCKNWEKLCGISEIVYRKFCLTLIFLENVTKKSKWYDIINKRQLGVIYGNT